MKDQDLGRVADSLRNHSSELKDEVEKLNDNLNNGKHAFASSLTCFTFRRSWLHLTDAVLFCATQT